MLKLFQQHWPRFLPFWLVPVLGMTGIVLGDTIDLSRVVRVCGLLVLVAYFFASFFFAHMLYVRRELSASQAMLLCSPFIIVWVVLVAIRALVLAILGRPL